jgi:hypothetical protein
MIKLRKLLSIAVIASICITVLSFSAYVNAYTEDINDMAAILNRLNILQGINGDYQLNNRLDRVQAITIIIRMLGKENYVIQNKDDLKRTKYSDVPVDSWYAPYVGYSTMNNIIAGDDEGKFLPTKPTSEKQFLKMLLCALGYEYGRDFDWTNVYQKAYETGLVIDQSYVSKVADNENFLRSAAVEIAFRSLNIYMKDTETKLVFKLEDEGVLSREEIFGSGIFGENYKNAIIEINPLSPNNIEIILDQRIKDVKKENIIIFDENMPDKNLEIKSVAFKDNIIQIITAGQIPSRPYRLNISKIADTNGYITDNLSGIFSGYTSQQIESDFFKINRIEQIYDNIINIYFTHPVNENSESPYYYSILENGSLWVSGDIQNMTVKKIQSVDNAVSLYLKDRSLKMGEVYTLYVDGKLVSNYGVKLCEGKGDIREFVATADRSEQLDVYNVRALSNNMVSVIFNREVDPVWAGKRLNYSVIGPGNIVIDVLNAAVINEGDTGGREVLLRLGRTLDMKSVYDLNIEYIPDIYKQSVLESFSYKFPGTYEANMEIAVIESICEQNNSVVLQVNKPLDSSSATAVSNYSIRGVSDGSFYTVPGKAYYTERNGSYTIKLFLPAGRVFKDGQKYSVYISNLKDTLGNAQKVTVKSEFIGSGNIILPQMIDAVTISKDAIKVLFNTEIAFNLSNISTSNFVLEQSSENGFVRIVPYGVNYIDPTTLVLRFDELDSSSTYKLSFKKISDYSEIYETNANSENNYIMLRWGK